MRNLGQQSRQFGHTLVSQWEQMSSWLTRSPCVKCSQTVAMKGSHTSNLLSYLWNTHSIIYSRTKGNRAVQLMRNVRILVVYSDTHAHTHTHTHTHAHLWLVGCGCQSNISMLSYSTKGSGIYSHPHSHPPTYTHVQYQSHTSTHLPYVYCLL